MEKCTFKGCETQGEPQDGFDFFVCQKCFDDLEEELRAAWLRHHYPPNLNN